MSRLTTKATRLGNKYGCRVLHDGVVILEARCETRALIGPTFRDLLRTLDKCGGDEFTAAARRRKFKDGNIQCYAKHIWSRRT